MLTDPIGNFLPVAVDLAAVVQNLVAWHPGQALTHGRAARQHRHHVVLALPFGVQELAGFIDREYERWRVNYYKYLWIRHFCEEQTR
ncbi:hypothetical protein GCM10011383_27890 [Hymenobacter cavernae]|uniref:Uncharacterized protein n=1 Tax=Hymenobacter cavernae TaxID=2044852 RepID=A0ABQ1UBH9_9BACT|nr:hypothetical protein GCM10011383_27890 [Hymenobacter cavernae]